MKLLLWIIGVALVLVGGFYALNTYIYNEKQKDEGVVADHKNGRYLIDGQMVELKNGESKVPAAPGSATMVTTKYFGNEARGDIDADGDEDIAFLVTSDGGGSGTFFYLVAALKEGSAYRGTEGVLVGDRIAPQTTEFRDGFVVVNYADRDRGEPMTAEPTVGKSLRLKYDSAAGNFGQVASDFEGEADPSRMNLSMKTWTWIEARYNDGRVLQPRQKQAFTLDLLEFGRFSATTDCNRIAGNYAAGADGALVFSDMISTKMYCEGSQETEFSGLLANTSHYHFTSRGELILDLKFDSGTVTFR